mmetsp:Transcript_2409/g.6027  ORF Transcript_2409/g.6027 Transcript_2409/m.6027 type:complete len:273 (-) Transcript_2409:191-1009(-)
MIALWWVPMHLWFMTEPLCMDWRWPSHSVVRESGHALGFYAGFLLWRSASRNVWQAHCKWSSTIRLSVLSGFQAMHLHYLIRSKHAVVLQHLASSLMSQCVIALQTVLSLLSHRFHVLTVQCLLLVVFAEESRTLFVLLFVLLFVKGILILCFLLLCGRFAHGLSSSSNDGGPDLLDLRHRCFGHQTHRIFWRCCLCFTQNHRPPCCIWFGLFVCHLLLLRHIFFFSLLVTLLFSFLSQDLYFHGIHLLFFAFFLFFLIFTHEVAIILFLLH